MSDEFKIQWSVSLPPAEQYAKGDMLNLRGDTVEELEGMLDAVLNGRVIDKATEAAKLLRFAAAMKNGDVPAEGPKDEPQAEDEKPNVTNLRRCDHGKRIRRTGKRKDESTWVGYFCPAKKCEIDWEK